MEKKIFKIKKNCRLCDSRNLKLSYDLGLNPIGDDYTKKKNNANLIPLKMMSCLNCGFKQLSAVVDPNKVYGNYLYTTSTSRGLKNHFQNSYNFLKKKIKLNDGDFVIDIGSNDGSNLEIFKNGKCKVLGIEPAKYLCKISEKKKIPTLNKFFDTNCVKKIISENGYPKLICIYNMMANVDNLNEFIKNIKRLMKKNTIVAVESFSLLGIIKKNLFDNIYHEHLSYFHINPLIRYFKKFDIEIFYAKNNNIKGGSIKIFLRLLTNNKKNQNIKNCLKYEKKLRLNSANVFDKIKKRNKANIIKISNFLEKLNTKKIAGFGASVGSTVFIHYYDLKNKIKILLDDEKRRNNLFSPSTNIKVYKPNIKILKQVDIVLIISWRYKNSIVKNFKKKFPKVFKRQKWFTLIPNISRIN